MRSNTNQYSSPIYDYVVIGLGAVGSAALYHLSKSGQRVLGLDRFHPPHSMGSSHGETRITRLAVGEGEEYVALAQRSHQLWREIEDQTALVLRVRSGGILMDSGLSPWEKHGAEAFLERTISFAQNAGIHHQILDSGEVRHRFPNFNLEKEGRAYFELEAGYLYPERCIQAQLELAQRNGAKIQLDTPVISLSEEGELLKLDTKNGEILAKRALLSAGGWIKDFLSKDERKQFKICRQVLHWMELDPHSEWIHQPVFMWGFGPKPEDFVYGFPSLDGKSVKMATESFLEVDHPDQLCRTVSATEQQQFWKEKVQGRINGLTGSFLRSEVCFYTVTEDAKFVIQPHQDFSNLHLVSACSGHGFKYSAALGEYLAEKMQGISTRIPDFI